MKTAFWIWLPVMGVWLALAIWIFRRQGVCQHCGVRKGISKSRVALWQGKWGCADCYAKKWGQKKEGIA